MKVWYHIVAAIVGLSTAALIVYAVFGNASQQGAVQDGSAPGGLNAEGAAMCGSFTPAEAYTPATRKLAGDNNPALFDAKGPFPAISDKFPDQQAWVARVHAAAGMCTDEIRFEDAGLTIAMSTVDGVSETDASAYAAGAIAQAFTKPLMPLTLTMRATVDEQERVTVISQRAWRAFDATRNPRAQVTMRQLAAFKRTTAFGPADLRITGWR